MTKSHIEGTQGIRKASRGMGHLEEKLNIDTELENEERVIPVGPWL